ncbi:phosphonoacetaldehyde hydrolase, partial [Mesorhizobium sp. M00.F.Ca.ET.186.01.1.1]
DIKEAVAAGAWAVGVIKGSSELGMTEQQVNQCGPDELADKMEAVAKRFKSVGADYVIDSIGELDKLIPKINLRLAQKER